MLSKLKYKLRRSKFVRVLYLPVAKIKDAIVSKNYPNSPDGRYMASIRDSHKGERCFIIGNGPSLTASDLDKLKDEFCFGVNRIYCIFEDTVWRPKAYVSVDMDVIGDERDNIKSVDADYKFINLNARHQMGEVDKNTHFIYIKGKFKINRSGTAQKTVNEDISKYISMTDNVTGICLQIAFYMGFSEIYLLGNDFNYPSMGKDSANSEQNYFKGMKGKTQVDFNAEANSTSFRTLRNYAENHGIKIFNATRGGKLEIFERADFDSVVGGKNAE
ncbi:MAG: DUF115 domain-containing protein [Clostridia bacterium]|nr:DUF115 domain-containing protein [Clostridia bacterium]